MSKGRTKNKCAGRKGKLITISSAVRNLLFPGAVFLLMLISSLSSTVTAATGLYDVNASGGDIRYVLEALAKQSSANIVIGPDVTGTITAHLKQMPLDELLNNLAQVHGFEWKKQTSTYVVTMPDKTPKPEVAPPPPVVVYESLVWRCRHIKANDLVTMLNDMFPDCKIAVGPSAVTPTLHTPLSSASEATGASTSSNTASSSTSQNGDSASTIVMYGQAADIARAKTLLNDLDKPSAQIAIEVTITEIGSNQSKDIGINWSWNDLTLTESAASGIRFGRFTKEPNTITGALAALAANDNAHLLAQPNISVIDGGYADILIGDRILFPKLVGYTQFGTPMYDKEEERVGIYLQIAPRVTEDDEIILTLYPQVSLVTSYLKTQAGDYPQISTREARTTVAVKSGATLAIGGLIKDEEIKNAEKIPLLGDLPIIGNFFRHSKQSKVRTEIVIFLTPRIVTSGDTLRQRGESGS